MSSLIAAEGAKKGLDLALEVVGKILTIAALRPDILDKILGPQQAVLDATIAALKEPPDPKRPEDQ